MGQYYYAVNLDKKEYIYSHDYNNGLKIMEHSYIGNELMNHVEFMLTPENGWHGNRIVWAGDYADPESVVSLRKLGCEKLAKELEELEKVSTDKVKYTKEGINIYGICAEWDKINPDMKGLSIELPRYIVNITKRQYVDKENLLTSGCGFIIHPLSILTCEGNGRGGGDFECQDALPQVRQMIYSAVGSWARNRIIMHNEPPNRYRELIFHVKIDEYDSSEICLK